MKYKGDISDKIRRRNQFQTLAACIVVLLLLLIAAYALLGRGGSSYIVNTTPVDIEFMEDSIMNSGGSQTQTIDSDSVNSSRRNKPAKRNKEPLLHRNHLDEQIPQPQ